jgi:tRNA pseudouridine(55) synthase
MSPHNTQKEEISQQSGGVFEVWKHEGETLADLVLRFRKEKGLPPEERITYAGRLDPMASGIVILLAGQARFEKERWNARKKTYEVDILLGIETDTLDMLGLVTKVCIESRENAWIEKVVADMKKITSLSYPMYSSRPVDGEPLFVHARRGTAVETPLKHVQIYDCVCVGIEERKLRTLIEETLPIFEKVSGDFRQAEIVKGWGEAALLHGEKSVQLVAIEVVCSSGTYMRSLAQWLGEHLGVPALAYRIVRTKVGE